MICPNTIDPYTPVLQIAGKSIEQTSHSGMTSRLAQQLGILKNKFLLLALIVLTLPVFALCQNDPLNPSFLPSIDTNAADYPSNIWITDTMQKVRQDSGSPGTQHWGTFYGTQNEFVDFQVHYHDTGSGTQNLNVTVSNFVQTAPSSFTISSAPTPLPPKVIVYREAYMDVTIPTATSSLYYGTTGYFPDALIPTVDPYWGQTTNAWPFNVAANHNQSAWVDVLIPQNAPAGYYLGTITVSSGSTTLAKMPVILAVWQWPSAGYMPSTTTLKTEETGWGYGSMCDEMYNGTVGSGSDTGCENYPDAVAYGGSNNPDAGVAMTWLDGDLLMKDHRYSSGSYEDFGPSAGNYAKYNEWVGPILSGGCVHQGVVCPVLQGAKNTTKEIQASTNNQANFAGVENNFIAQGWAAAGNTPLYYYLYDEPNENSGAWSQINSNAALYHAWDLPLPSEPMLVTTKLSDMTTYGALNSVDIAVVTVNDMDPYQGTLQRSAYDSWLAGNCCGAGSSPTRQLWSYEACDSVACGGNPPATWPDLYVDSFPVGNRVMEWLTFYHNQSGELYYGADWCYQTQANCGNAGANDPWVNIYAYGGWGDGTLIYVGCIVPGHPCYMGPGVTTPIIMPSIRLKHTRDGVQDYEYLNALTNAGQGALVQQQIQSWITNSYTFEKTGTGLQTARRALGTALHQLTFGGATLSPPTNLQAIVR